MQDAVISGDAGTRYDVMVHLHRSVSRGSDDQRFVAKWETDRESRIGTRTILM